MGRLRRIVLAATLAWDATISGRAPAAFEERITALYRPLQAEQVALSPDGEYIAYTHHERGELAIYIMTVARTERRFKIVVEGDRAVAFSKAKAPPRLRFLRWASPGRLVFAPTEYDNGARVIAPIFAVNRDGTEPKNLAEADDFALFGGEAESLPTVLRRRTSILGFMPGNRTALFVEARGQPTFPPADPIPTALLWRTRLPARVRCESQHPVLRVQRWPRHLWRLRARSRHQTTDVTRARGRPRRPGLARSRRRQRRPGLR